MGCGDEQTPDRAKPEQHYGRPYENYIDDIVAQVIDQIGRDQLVEAVLSGKGGERFREITESLTRNVNATENQLSVVVGYLVAICDDLETFNDHFVNPGPESEPPLVQTGPGGDFTKGYTPGKNVDMQG